MSYKKRDLHIIPTDDKNYYDIKIGRRNKMFSESEVSSQKYMNNEPVKHYHIYITSDEKINKGEWYYDSFDRKIRQSLSDVTVGSAFFKSSKKIVATTNTSLTTILVESDKGSMTEILPQIPRNFLNKLIVTYNNGEVVKQVFVEYFKEETEPMSYVFTEKLRVDIDNNINIKFLKKSWTREEHEKNLRYCVAEIAAKLGHASTSEEMKVWNIETDKWIKENL